MPFDRFRDRVMFPIADFRGRAIAFGGRALEKDAQAKYLNSPETPLFHKGATLYNIAARARPRMTARSCVAVEGYVDVIAMVTAGFPATVAPLGTALTEDQLALLWKMADEPVLCFDGDNAGLRAAYRAVELAMPRLKPGKSLKFALLPQGQDPDDLFRSGGREAIADVIGAARPLAAMLWARETEGHSFETPERRAALEARINEVTAGIADDSVRKYYRQDFSARLAQFFAPAHRIAPARQFPARANRNFGQNWRERRANGNRATARRSARQPAARTRPMWWSASNWRRARCIAATASPFRRARRSSCRPRSIIPGCCTTIWRNWPRSSSAMPTPKSSRARWSTSPPMPPAARCRGRAGGTGRAQPRARPWSASAPRSPPNRSGAPGRTPRPRMFW